MGNLAHMSGGQRRSGTAVVLQEPRRLQLAPVDLTDPGPSDVLVRTHWTSISSGTERLLFDGRMPTFPGLAYPLVPGYESVGDVIWAGPESGRVKGERVFVPGATCYADLQALFGGACSRLLTSGTRVTPVPESLGADALLLALAATALHAIKLAPEAELVIGHGVVGRLLARLLVQAGGTPTVWETDPQRRWGADGYRVLDPDADQRRDFRCIIDASGDAAILDSLIAALTPGGLLVLAGFYSEPLQFTFPPAFMRELRLQIAAEFSGDDMVQAMAMVRSGELDLAGLRTHQRPCSEAHQAYAEAFEDRACLKMVLDWEELL